MSPRFFEAGPGVRCAVAENPGPLTLDGTRNYRVGQDSGVLLDPGPAGEGQAARIRRLAGEASILRVLLTHAHPDHAGGAAELARRLGVPVSGSAGTLERIGAEGEALEGGDRIPLPGGRELRVLETPGHSADHLCFALFPERAVFTGDTVLGEGTAMVAHPDGHMGSYLASLEELLSLRPRRLYPGHGPPVEAAVERLEEYRRHRLERERQILGALEEGADSVAAVRRRVYPELPADLEPAAEASVRAHLVHLEEQGHELSVRPEEDG